MAEPRLPLLLLGLLLPVAVAQAEVYRWVDEKGRVHYGDRPAGNEAERVELHTRPTEKDPGMEQRRKKQQKLLKVLEEERRKKEAAQAEARAEQEAREQDCKKARERLSRYRNANFIYTEKEDGSRVILEGEEYERVLREAREAVQRFCE